LDLGGSVGVDGPKSQSSVSVPLVATTVVTFAYLLKRIDESRIDDFTGLGEIVEQSIAFNIDIGINVMCDLPRRVT
jgi:hypothetical protein